MKDQWGDRGGYDPHLGEMKERKSSIMPRHSAQEYPLAHRDASAPPVTATILNENTDILKAVGHYLRTAARSHPCTRGGHWHAQVNKARVGAYSFMLTLEEGHKDHPEAQYLPREHQHIHDPDCGNGTDNARSIDVGEFAPWYWHLSMVQFHEDSGAQLPVPIDQAVSLAEKILGQSFWAEWFHYGVNVGEPLVIHVFIPHRGEEAEDGNS